MSADDSRQNCHSVNQQKSRQMRKNRICKQSHVNGIRKAIGGAYGAGKRGSDEIRRNNGQNAAERMRRKQLAACDRQRMEKVRLIAHMQIAEHGDTGNDCQCNQHKRDRTARHQRVADIHHHAVSFQCNARLIIAQI